MSGIVVVEKSAPAVSVGGHPLRELREFLDFCRETQPGMFNDPAFLPWYGHCLDHLDVQQWKKTTLKKVVELLTELQQPGHPYWLEQTEFYNPFFIEEMKVKGIDFQAHMVQNQSILRHQFADVAAAIDSILGEN